VGEKGRRWWYCKRFKFGRIFSLNDLCWVWVKISRYCRRWWWNG